MSDAEVENQTVLDWPAPVLPTQPANGEVQPYVRGNSHA